MGDGSAIEWTDATWSPVVGCTHVSPGCDFCYAAREASGRLRGVPVYAGLAEGGKFTGEVRCLPERLDQPLRWRKPRRIFVNSMSDLFHRAIPDDFINRVFAVMAEAPQHTFQVLTKRPQRMGRMFGEFDSLWDDIGVSALPNVWLGTSIESDRYVWRADHIREMDAAVRWLSLEPLLGPLPSLDLTGIDWVVVGGESGPKARPMHPDWVRDIRDRCVAAGIPFFHKQWGEWAPDDEDGRRWAEKVGCSTRCFIAPDGHVTPGPAFGIDSYAMHRLGKKAAGRTLDGRTWDEYPADREAARTGEAKS